MAYENWNKIPDDILRELGGYQAYNDLVAENAKLEETLESYKVQEACMRNSHQRLALRIEELEKKLKRYGDG